jgi:6-phosphogluconolactonase/glucosamine-6-phosphate isomerase/deaminase
VSAGARRFGTTEALGQALADEIVDRCRAREGKFLRGCPGGRSLVTTTTRRPRAARATRVVLVGRDKREAVRRLLTLDAFDPAWPASIVHECRDAEIWIEREASP